MQTTKNYKFKKPELTDSPPDITVLNGNFDVIDEKLFAVIQAWEKFKDSGGEIGGEISTPTGKLLNVSDFDISKESNGYTKLPNGMIMQWLYVGGRISQGKGVIEGNLPITFPNNYLSIFANVTYIDDDSTYNNLFNCNAKFVNRGYFNVNIKNLESSSGSFANCYILAIGY